MRYDAVLFDLDNTLYDYDSYWRARLVWSLEPVQAACPWLAVPDLVAAAIRQRVYARGFADFLQHQGVDDAAVCAAAQARYRINTYETLTLFAETEPVIERLRGCCKLGLITNGPCHSQRPKIAQFGLERQMDVVLVSEEVGYAKPDPAIFWLALQRLGVAPARALYVGDSQEHDLLGAHAAGIDFVWMNPQQQPLAAGMPPPLATIARLDGLLELLQLAGEGQPTPADWSTPG